MDKRSLLFLACVSLAYFGIQAFFGSGSPDPAKSLDAKALIERNEKGRAVELERASRTANLEEFPAQRNRYYEQLKSRKQYEALKQWIDDLKASAHLTVLPLNP